MMMAKALPKPPSYPLGTPIVGVKLEFIGSKYLVGKVEGSFVETQSLCFAVTLPSLCRHLPSLAVTCSQLPSLAVSWIMSTACQCHHRQNFYVLR